MITLRTYEMEDILRTELLLLTARHLTLYSTSGMNIALNRFQALLEGGNPIKAKGIFAYEGEWACGWCLLTQEADGMDFSPQEGYACVQIFVADQYRRKGIGSLMLKEAASIATGSLIQCYSSNNPQFFKPFIKQSNFKSFS